MDETERLHQFMAAKARLSLRDRLVPGRRHRRQAEFMVTQYRAFLATLAQDEHDSASDRPQSAGRS